MAQTTPELEAVIKRFRQSLEMAGIRCQQVLLYGSRRWGTAGEDSDIDLIVISPDWAPLNQRERLELLGVIAARLLEPIQAQGWTPQEIADQEMGTFWQEIVEKEAVTV
jgi:predicted nucleotidyltransferase